MTVSLALALSRSLTACLLTSALHNVNTHCGVPVALNSGSCSVMRANGVFEGCRESLNLKSFVYISLAGTIYLLFVLPADAENLTIKTAAPRLSEIERPATTIKEWRARLEKQGVTEKRQRQFWLAQSPITISGVRLNPTQDGLEIILETAGGEPLEGITSSQDNRLIVEISNAQLQLPKGQDFRQENPAPRIASVTVIATNPNQLQITVTGIDSLPDGTIVQSQSGLVLSVISSPEIEILVTAQKRPELAQDVPISITALSQETLEDAQIDSLQDIANNTPNFSFFPTNAGGSDFNYYSIRGLNNFNFLVSQDSAGFYIDDVPFDFGAFLDLGLLDLERVEVLRGPQSTLYGRSSPAGVVNIITRPPTNFSEFRVAGGYGNYNFREAQLSYSIALPSL